MKFSQASLVCWAFLTLAIPCLRPTCLAVDIAYTNNMLSQAEQALALAYRSAVQAELAGANVSVLIERLNDAGEVLAGAFRASYIGDYQNACSLAVQCYNEASKIVYNATVLKMEAEATYKDKLVLTVIGSSVALSALLIASLLGWKILKKEHLNRILKMKPQAKEG